MIEPTRRRAYSVIGRYAVFSEIASGGMAAIHLGRLLAPAGFAETVAIKRLHRHLANNPEFAAMFLDETRVAARIRHPHVVPTLDVVEADGELLLVLEYVHGESLEQLLRTVRSDRTLVPPPIVAAILSGVLRGLDAAHRATNERGQPLRLVHRDVSPQNILVGEDGAARVVDFGIAKAAGRLRVTRNGQTHGKVQYMSPEQITDGPVDALTDVYSAGVVLWEALTARRLFDRPGDLATAAQIRDGAASPPSAFVPSLPRAFDAVTMRALATSRDARFPSAAAMALALEGCGPIASPHEVSAWVRDVARETLAFRARTLREIENAVLVGGVPAPWVAPPPAAHPAIPSALPTVRDLGRLASLATDPLDEAPALPHGERAGAVVPPGLCGASLAAGVVLGSASRTIPGEKTRSQAARPRQAT